RRSPCASADGPRPRPHLPCAARPTLLLLRNLCARVGRCHLTRRGCGHKSSHRPFKTASKPAILRRVSSYAASLRAIAKVFGNPHVRSLQLAGAGSILGTYAYAVALPIYAYHSGGARTVGLVFFPRFVFAAL